ncbi:MAG: radical SAM protein, partial [Armatimonadetes bacterium]|nr:radical SAM protein [Armatimonadota bacterium]
ELVLCGIRLGAYGEGRDSESLRVLLRNLRELPPRRLRLSSIEPMDIDQDLLGEITDHPALCHHLHLPLQSGDDTVLAAMNRGYTTTDFRDLAARIRKHWPDAALTTDIMVGFPGETDDQFGHSLAFLEEMHFTRVHVFPYSRRSGTPAADRQDQVPATVMKDRVRQTLELADQLASTAARQWVGKSVSVLFEERVSDGNLVGHTEHYLRVHAPGPEEWVGRLRDVIPTRIEQGSLIV